MIRVLVCSALLGLSALHAAKAEEPPAPMTPELCLSGWQSFNFLIGTPPRLRAIQPNVTETGWCRIDRSFADLRENDFASVEYRATGIEAAVKNRGVPLTFEADFQGISLVQGLKMDLGPGNENAMGALKIKAQRDPASFDFLIEKLLFDAEDLGSISLTASGGGIDLKSLERMQLTLGGMRLTSLVLDLDTTRDLSRALRPVIEEVASLRDWVQVLNRLPAEMFTAGSRDALMRFARAMPAAKGTLTLRMQSETGLGLVQIIGATMTLEESGGRISDIAAAVEQLVTGSTIDATWTP
ncbi:hypothetical protein [Roseovarius rhodophyticola]|uniref:DUF2125 domain-containing protein n=1 Tax=Roseovarius rhodophyticola TaxID=3080827 RepID=A0ABZ2TJ86_9RHOB|nr:hypothetical protein [Roseovarius sp. W115]MDV2928748.1 hypothetical protein [Roseovarius sp. W115]